jgi:hypothetical protein
MNNGGTKHMGIHRANPPQVRITNDIPKPLTSGDRTGILRFLAALFMFHPEINEAHYLS